MGSDIHTQYAIHALSFTPVVNCKLGTDRALVRVTLTCTSASNTSFQDERLESVVRRAPRGNIHFEKKCGYLVSTDRENVEERTVVAELEQHSAVDEIKVAVNESCTPRNRYWQRIFQQDDGGELDT